MGISYESLPIATKLLHRVGDMEKQVMYRAGDPESEFRPTTRDAEIDRGAQHGIGLPPDDIQLFKNKHFIGQPEMKWGCLLRIYKKDRHNWHQVYGHIRAIHFYKSRPTNGRRNISFREKAENIHGVGTITRTPHIAAIQIELCTRRIREIDHNNITTCQCVQRNEIKTLPLNITRRIYKNAQ